MKVRNRAAVILGAGVLMIAASFSSTVFAVGQKVTLCHATSSESHPYQVVTTDISSDGYVQGGHADHGNDGVWYPGAKGDKFNWGDIIPAYDTEVNGDPFHYDGLNLADGGQEILDAGCLIPGETPEPTVAPTPTPTFGSSNAGETDAPTEPNTATIGGNGTSGPADSAWLLVVALGVLLASVVVLTPARAKSRR